MALNTFASGVDTSLTTKLNDNFKALGKIQAVYTSTGFNVSVFGANQDTSASYETADIAAADLGDADYIQIQCYVQASATGGAGDSGTCRLKFETKELGGAYATSMAEQTVHSTSGSASQDISAGGTRFVSWIHTLTSNEKSLGVKIKITGRCTTSNDGANSATLTNVQTVVRNGV